MRFATVASLILLLTACGDDGPILTDTSPRDTGARDTGMGDTGTIDTGMIDTGMIDTGRVDSGPPTCEPTASGITFPSREWEAVVVASGATVNEPVGVAWNGADVMLFSNSSSWIGAGTDPGDVLQNDGGSLGVFAMDALMLGPGHIAWTAGMMMGFEEGLYLAIEDGTTLDAVLRISADGMTVGVLSSNVEEPGELEFGTGGDFGDDLYVTSRERADSSAPNPYEVYTIAADGTTTRFAISDGGSNITGAYTMEFGPGGALGTDLYLGTIEDPGFSPGSVDAIYRVRASDGEANVFATGVRTFALAAPRPPGGDFGERLYAVTANAIFRYDSRGVGEMFAEGIMSSAGLRFGPDGALYVAQPGAGRVIRISRCPAR